MKALIAAALLVDAAPTADASRCGDRHWDADIQKYRWVTGICGRDAPSPA